MTNIIPVNTNVPAHIAARMQQGSAVAAALGNGLGGGFDYPRLSIKGSRFRVVENGEENVIDALTIDVIVIGANPNKSKTWFEKKWNPNDEPAGPDCWSQDGIRPDPEAEKPQNDTCQGCPWDVIGSAQTDNGTQMKACSDKKRLAVLAADDPEGPIYLLDVSASALKGLNQYQKALNQRGYPVEMVRTKLSFDTTVSFPKLAFSFNGFVDDAVVAIVDERIVDPQVKDITGQARAEQVAALPAPAPKAAAVAPKAAPVKAAAPKPAPKPAPAPVVEEVEEEVEEMPAPVAAPAKRGFGAKAAAPAPAPAPAAAAPAKRGFGAKAAAPAAAAPKAAPVAAAASTLAADIADLMAEVGADDE